MLVFSEPAFSQASCVQSTAFTGTNSQNGRIFRDAIPASCPSKAYPGIFNPGTPYFFETFTYTNVTASTQCVQIDFDPNPDGNLATDCDTNAHASAYLNSYDPANQSVNFLGDVGSSITDSFSVDIPAGQDMVLVVTNTSAEEICNFQVKVNNIACTAPTVPSFSKAFSPASTTPGGTSTLSLTIDNTTSALNANALSVTDPFPAGLVVAPTPNASTTCTGGTLTAAAGANSVTYSGGSVAAGASCAVQVDVVAAAAGTYNNTTNNLTSFLGDSGTANAILSVLGALVTNPIPTLQEYGVMLLAGLIVLAALIHRKRNG